MTTFLDQSSTAALAWEGALEPLGETLRSAPTPPRISLGQPMVWNAAAAVKNELGRDWSPPRADLAYALVGLPCTLHPLPNEDGRYTTARLEAYLRPRYGRGTALAHDLFPLRHTVQDKGKLSVGLTPELKFASAIAAKLLEVGVEKEHTAVYPVIQAYGLGEPNPYWEFKQHSQFPLQGSQKLYLLAAGPADAPLVLRLNLVADVEYHRWGVLRYGPPQSASDRLSFEITNPAVGQ
ncbi:MAG: hypothetical protein IPM53_06240 [Anaerolineaceae bacterium]|nr:hypothetical protein [Anaerolineaceae bacterium]